MYCVQWMHDASAAEVEYTYFTRGDLDQQQRDAEAFAASLGIDPERGYVTVRKVPSGATAHPELR